MSEDTKHKLQLMEMTTQKQDMRDRLDEISGICQSIHDIMTEEVTVYTDLDLLEKDSWFNKIKELANG